MIKFRKHQKNVEKEADLAYKIEAAKARELEHARRALMAQNMRAKRRHRILTSLLTVDYEAKHTKLSRLQHPGTNKWLQTNSRFSSWLSSQSSDCLPCYGIPGAGKSVLAASLSNDLRASSQQDQSLICHYYCDYADAASLDSNCLIASLIKQVLVCLPLDCFDDSFACPFGAEKRTPEFETSAKFLGDLLCHFKTIFVTLDGIDELPRQCQQVTLDLIRELTNRPTATVKVFVTSRTEEQQVRWSLRDCEAIDLSAVHRSNDIEMFINSSMNSSLMAQNVLMQNESLKNEVIHALVDGAQGMFLWVKLQMHDIAETVTEAAVRSTIRNLPRDLDRTYERALDKAWQYGGRARIDLIRNIFRWLACARRPLRMEELEEAVGLEKTDTHLHADRTAMNAGERLVRACGNLVMYNNIDGTVTFAHHTIQTYLFTVPWYVPGQPINSTFLERSSSNQEIGEICIAYLSFSDFETQLASVPKKAQMGRKEIEQMIWGQVPVARWIQGMLSGIQSGKKLAIDRSSPQITLAHPVPSDPSDALAKKHLLLDYIVTYWTHHTAGFKNDSPSWAAFENVVLVRQLTFDFRPWLEEQHQKSVSEIFLRLQPTRSRFWQRHSSPLSEEERKALLIYSWALDHVVTSLLTLWYQLDERRYLQTKYADLSSGTIERYREAISHLDVSPSILWDKDIVLAFLHTQQSFFIAARLDVLDVLEAEMKVWVRRRASSQEQIFEMAIGHLASYGWQRDGFKHLFEHYCTTSEKLGKISIQLCQADAMDIKNIRMLLSQPTTGTMSDETKYKLACALHYCVLSLKDDPSPIREEHSRDSSGLLWLLQVVSLLSTGCEIFLNHLLYYGFDQEMTFNVPELLRSSTSLGSDSFRDKLASLDGLDLLGIAISRAHTLNSTLTLRANPWWYDIINKLLRRYGADFEPDYYEARQLHLLNWSIEWDLHHCLDDIRRGYRKLFRHRGLAVGVLERAMHYGPAYMAKVIDMQWPLRVIKEALQRPNNVFLSPEHRKVLSARLAQTLSLE